MMNTIGELDFAIFCVESVAEYLGVSGGAVYALLARDSGILDDYVIPSYDVLHTQSKEYIVNDVVGYMREEGLIQ
jgi:hypothetical protein